MPSGYQTKQKEIIRQCLSEQPTQSFLAKEVFLFCQRAATPVGLATIYRQLERLVEEGTARKIIAADNSGVRFQYLDPSDGEGDFFLKCECCGEVMPAACHLLERVASHMDEEHGFSIDTSRSMLYGRCKKCK